MFLTNKEGKHTMLKSKIVLSAVALSTISAFALADDVVVQEEKDYGVYGYASIDVASACISGSGYATTDALNFQPCVGVGGNLWGWLPMEFCMWAVYTTDNDAFNNMYHDSGFAEIDLSLTHAQSFDNGFGYSISYTTWAYPDKIEGEESEELIEAVASQTLFDHVKASFEVEWMLTGPAEKDVRMMPAITVFGNITDDIEASARGMLFYKASHEGEDGWSNWNVKLALSGYGFSVYAQWFKEIDEDVYGEPIEDFVYGVSYGFDF